MPNGHCRPSSFRFRPAGRPTGVELQGGLFLQRPVRWSLHRTAVKPIVKGLPVRGNSGADGNKLSRARQFGPEFIDSRAKLNSTDQKPRFRVVEDVKPFRPREPVVQRHGHNAGFGASVVDEGIFEAIFRKDGDAISGLEPGLEARFRSSIRGERKANHINPS